MENSDFLWQEKCSDRQASSPAPACHCAAEHSLSHSSEQHGLFLLPVQHLALLSKMLPHSYDSSLRLQDVSSPTGCATAEQLGESSVPAPLNPTPCCACSCVLWDTLLSRTLNGKSFQSHPFLYLHGGVRLLCPCISRAGI